jgi:NtrC-family two-component system response regulator AlgB
MAVAEQTSGRILLVDDEAAILRTFRYCLEDEGYDVAGASSATQAEALLPELGELGFGRVFVEQR